MTNKIILSICITSYNRGELIEKNLRKMLEYKDSDVEFVISDNSSEDDTLERIKNIGDPRIKIFQNKSNVGFKKNAYLSYVRALGKYFIQLNDRDYFYPESIGKIVSFLKTRDYDMCVLREGGKRSSVIKSKKIDMRQGIFYIAKNIHPGSMLYKTNNFSKILSKDEIEKIEFVSENELDNRVLAERCRIIIEGKYIDLEYNMLHLPSSAQLCRIGQNRGDCKGSKKNYFEPKALLENMEYILGMYFNIKLNKEFERKLIEEYYRNYLYKATSGFKKILSDKYMCKRYNYNVQEKNQESYYRIQFDFFIKTLNFLWKRKKLNFCVMITLVKITILNTANI